MNYFPQPTIQRSRLCQTPPSDHASQRLAGRKSLRPAHEPRRAAARRSPSSARLTGIRSAFIRRRGHEAELACDLTQGYFIRLLETGALAAVDHKKGRFRAFLRTDCGFFLADQRDRRRALKRGGGAVPVSIDARDAEGRYRVEPSDAVTPERLFDRAWAVTLLERALDQLVREYTESGRAVLFERLKSVLSDGPLSLSYRSIGAELAMSEVAVQSAVQRLRKRFRALIRDEIAATLDAPTPADIEDEIRTLFTTLGR